MYKQPPRPRSNALVIVALMVVFFQPAFAEESRLVVPHSPGDEVALTILHEVSLNDAPNFLQVSVRSVTEGNDINIAIAGRYEVEGRKISFKPLFDFVQGQAYLVKYKVQSNNRSFTTVSFQLASPAVDSEQVVTSIYPQGNVLPENTLRFYIEFSQPMKPHVASNYIKLLNEQDKEDAAAFMNFKQELWSEERRRLTLLMDPGRIKRAVATNLKLGPALEAGKQYRLVVKQGWLTADGTAASKDYVKTFKVSSALRSLPSMSNWQFVRPRVHSRDPLLIHFDRVFDFQQLHKAIAVIDGSGQLVAGKVSIINGGHQWRFIPQEEWQENSITVVVDATLEDVAGNNFIDLLDHKVGINTKPVNTIKTQLMLK